MARPEASVSDDVAAEAVRMIRVDAIERVLTLLENNRALLASETFGGWLNVLHPRTRERLIGLRERLHGTKECV